MEPMSGYDLGKNLRESLGYFWAESNGQIYPTLKRLATDVLILPVPTHPAGRRVRQKYALTPAGRKRLRDAGHSDNTSVTFCRQAGIRWTWP